MSRTVATPTRAHATRQKAGAEPGVRKASPGHNFVLGPSNQVIRSKGDAGPTWEQRTARATATVAHGGEPLPRDVRAYFEPRYGHDFSGVRVHRDPSAAEAADAIDANAYTVGNHIAFAPEKFAPHTQVGRKRIGHELAHVVQQRRGGATPTLGSATDTERAAESAAAAGTGRVQVRGASGIGIAREESEESRSREAFAVANRIYTSFITSPHVPERVRKGVETANEEAKAVLRRAGVSDDQRAKLVGGVLRSVDPATIATVQQIADGPTASPTPAVKAVPPERSEAQREKEAREAIAQAARSGTLYHDPLLDRPAAELRAREAHNQLRAISPEIAEALDQDPGYARARGVFKEDPSAAVQIDVPPTQPGVASPITLDIDGTRVRLESPAYQQSPRGRASIELRRRIVTARHALEALEGERKDIVESSVVIRKTAEGMVGIDPPPVTELTRIRGSLTDALNALDKDEVEAAARKYTDATERLRMAQWYWSRYKEFIQLGAERTAEALEAVRDTSKYTLMVLSMGGGAAFAVGTLGMIAIDSADTASKAALGEPVDWKKFALEQAVQIVVARFGGRFSKGVVGGLARNPAFAKFNNTLITEAVVGVLSGMEARVLTTGVSAGYDGKTWGQLLDEVIASATDPKFVVFDLILTAAHSKLRGRTPPAATPREAPRPESAGTRGGSGSIPTQSAPTRPTGTSSPEPKTAAAPSQEPPSGLELDKSGKPLGTGEPPALHERNVETPGADTGTSLPAGAKAPTELVWLNTKTNVYHHSDSRFFGTTKEGRFMPESEALKNPAYRAAQPPGKRGVSTYTRISQEAGRLQEKVVSDITGWPKNNQGHPTEFGNRIPDYLPAKDPATNAWITASRPEDALFVADSKYYDEKLIGANDQIRGFVDIAARTNPPQGGVKTLILFTNETARISPEVFAWAAAKGVTVRQIFQHRSR